MVQNMRALRFNYADSSTTLDQEYPIPTLEVDEALVKVHLAGICATVGIKTNLTCVDMQLSLTDLMSRPNA